MKLLLILLASIILIVLLVKFWKPLFFISLVGGFLLILYKIGIVSWIIRRINF